MRPIKHRIRTTYTLLAALSIAAGLTSCVPDVEHPVAPELTFVSISQTNVESASTELIAVIAYRDRQGDLGWDGHQGVKGLPARQGGGECVIAGVNSLPGQIEIVT